MQQILSKLMQQCRKGWHHGQTVEWIDRGDHNIRNVLCSFQNIEGDVGGGGTG